MKKKRKRDRRTVARIHRERVQRAAIARRARGDAAVLRRLALLPALLELVRYGLGPSSIARELEARRLPTVQGAKRWHARQVQRLLDHFEPYFQWREMEPSRDSAAFYLKHVKALLAGTPYYAFVVGPHDVKVPEIVRRNLVALAPPSMKGELVRNVESRWPRVSATPF